MKLADIRPGMLVRYRRQGGTTEDWEVKRIVTVSSSGRAQRLVEVRGTRRRFHPRELAEAT